jgi:hypothetical protein
LTLGNGRDIVELTFYPDESEVLVPMLSRFVVVDRVVKKDVNLVIINVRELPMVETIVSFSTPTAAGNLFFSVNIVCIINILELYNILLGAFIHHQPLQSRVLRLQQRHLPSCKRSCKL